MTLMLRMVAMLNGLKQRWKNKKGSKNGGGLFDLDNKRKRVKEIEEAAGRPDFWNNSEDASAMMQEIGLLKERLEVYDRLAGLFEEWEVLLQLYEELDKEEDAPALLQEAGIR